MSGNKNSVWPSDIISSKYASITPAQVKAWVDTHVTNTNPTLSKAVVDNGSDLTRYNQLVPALLTPSATRGGKGNYTGCLNGVFDGQAFTTSGNMSPECQEKIATVAVDAFFLLLDFLTGISVKNYDRKGLALLVKGKVGIALQDAMKTLNEAKTDYDLICSLLNFVRAAESNGIFTDIFNSVQSDFNPWDWLTGVGSFILQLIAWLGAPECELVIFAERFLLAESVGEFINDIGQACTCCQITTEGPVQNAYAMDIAKNWPGLPDGFTGKICALRALDYIYFFKNDQYWRFDIKANKCDAGPMSIRPNWKKLPDSFSGDFDAAVAGGPGYEQFCYFFKNDQYIRYNLTTDSCDWGPVNISDNWKGLPDGFTSDIDCMINGLGGYKQFLYIFKGNSYVRFNWSTNSCDAGPMLIQKNWPGAADGFFGNFEAAVELENQGKDSGEGDKDGWGYFFKNSKYLRFSWQQNRFKN